MSKIKGWQGNKNNGVDAIDASPEFMRFQDTGCYIAPSCLNCPLELCIHDDPVRVKLDRRKVRDATIVTALKGGESVEVLAERFSLTERSIVRAQTRVRKGE